jgi:hypothetical protein
MPEEAPEAEVSADRPVFSLEGEPEMPAWLQDQPAEQPDDAPVMSPPPAQAPDSIEEIAAIAPAPSDAAVSEEPLPPPAMLHPAQDQAPAVEAGGVLAGVSSPLAAQIPAASVADLVGGIPLPGGAEAIRQAANQFHAIATQAPQPAALPQPLTRRDRLVKRAGWAIFYLIFMALIAAPLIPGLQKASPANPAQRVPWTEPSGDLSEVLDSQRRALISSELGIIDLQQPGAVALVSFDYTPATQGEMQPLAQAVIGRLRGQGMRLIMMSLQPEGAALARRTMQETLAERAEPYGDNFVYAGYLPGQTAAVRALAGGQQPFSALFQTVDGAAPGPAWAGVQTIAQVDVVVSLADNPATARWWIEQLELAAPAADGERFVLSAASAAAAPFLKPYRQTGQLDGLITGINGAAALEAVRKSFGPARQMLDSQSVAHLLIIILIALGTIIGWMPPAEDDSAGSGPAQAPPPTAGKSS